MRIVTLLLMAALAALPACGKRGNPKPPPSAEEPTPTPALTPPAS